MNGNRPRLAPCLALLLAGCLTHLPPKADHCHMRIRWAASFEEARARALDEGHPVLAVLAAGKLDGLC